MVSGEKPQKFWTYIQLPFLHLSLIFQMWYCDPFGQQGPMPNEDTAKCITLRDLASAQKNLCLELQSVICDVAKNNTESWNQAKGTFSLQDWELECHLRKTMNGLYRYFFSFTSMSIWSRALSFIFSTIARKWRQEWGIWKGSVAKEGIALECKSLFVRSAKRHSDCVTLSTSRWELALEVRKLWVCWRI